jgi:hypothetical protein
MVIVLGMHRSGTSLCAHILSAMGIDMADEISAHASNARGHWERWEIVEFHDRILRLFNRDYFGPLHDLSLPVAWWADPHVSEIKREIIAFLERRMGAGWFGFKDPRTVRLMPLWHQIFNDLKLAPKIVLCSRNPAHVARSLGERDNLDPALAEYRWLVYMVDFFRYCGRFEVCTVDYEGWFGDPYANFNKLRDFLDLEWQQSQTDLDLVLSGIVDPGLRHDASHYNEPHQPLVSSLYRLAGDCARNGGVRDELNNFLAQFISFQRLQAPLHQTLENFGAVAAKYPELEQEAVALRAEVDQHAATEAALRAELEQHAATEAAQRTEIEQHAATEAALRAEIEQREATEAALRGDLEKRVETEFTLRAALGRAEREIADRQARRETAEAEVAAIRQALTKTDRRLRERAETAEALRTELNVLHSKLLEAERRVQQSEAATAALQDQISSLQSELGAAREVGRAALEALRYGIAMPPEAPRNTAWRTSILQHLGFRARARFSLAPAAAGHSSPV